MILQALLTWIGEKFERDVQIEITDDGRIARAGNLGAKATRVLQSQAILPGLISAHSHAFQRGLRGYGETFPEGQGSFWSWRESMYSLVEELDRDRFYQLCLGAFREMLAAGITTVGEFHYLHEFDEAVLEAAREVGIRIVLLDVFYRTGGIGRPLEGPRLRFLTPSLEEFWKRTDALQGRLDSRTQTIGVAPHSIRAATPDEIAELYQEATRRGLVVHMHLEEQQREIEEARSAYGKAPMRLLLDRLDIGANFTAVHCTHTEAADLERFLGCGGNICLAPLTEANLGDGIPRGALLRSRPAQLSLGTDSNARISMLEEMRWLEYAQRLSSQTRGIFRHGSGANARTLLEIATRGGARSLGVSAGAIEAGTWADLVAIGLDSPSLAGWTDATLLEMLIFGAGNEVIASTCVGGRWVS